MSVEPPSKLEDVIMCLATSSFGIIYDIFFKSYVLAFFSDIPSIFLFPFQYAGSFWFFSGVVLLFFVLTSKEEEKKEEWNPKEEVKKFIEKGRVE